MSTTKLAPSLSPERPDYGIDAPGVLRNLFVIGLVLLVLGLLGPRSFTIASVTLVLRPMFLGTGFVLLIEAFLMFLYVKRGKFRHRDRMLKLVNWRGNEQVLDVGTGRGLLMIAAAKRLANGCSVGIDIWSQKDMGGNSQQRTLRNADLEGVRDRVEIRTEDATRMSFPDSTFDVVVSNLCIHNIPSRAGRDAACREIYRVLKPGGKAIISDFIKTGDYAKCFRDAGAKTARRSSYDLFTFPPLRIVEVEKP